MAQRRGLGTALMALGVVCGLLVAGCGDDELARMGDTCARDDQCTTGRCDELVCKSGTPLEEDEPCAHPLECRSENCLFRLDKPACGPGTRLIGVGCTEDAQCESGRCVDYLCVPATVGPDAGVDVTPSPDAGLDAGPPDSTQDAGAPDSTQDAGEPDVALDAEAVDSALDAAVPDSTSDSGMADVGAPDFVATIASSWTQQIGGVSGEGVGGVAVDPSGNIVIAGSFQGTTDLGGGPLTSAGGSDIFVASYTSTGSHRWSRRFGGASGDSVSGVAVDADGNLTIVGFMISDIDFGGGLLTSVGGDAYVASFSSTGAYRWAAAYGDTVIDEAKDVAVDASGNVYVIGQFQGRVRFAGSPLTSAGSFDVFMASYSPNGNGRWSMRLGAGDVDLGHGVAVDAAGNVVLTGAFKGTVDFGGGYLTSAGDYDGFVASYTSTGAYRWAKRFGDIYGDHAYAAAIDANGNVTATGEFLISADFGGGVVSSSGASDVFVASYTATGTHRWSHTAAGTSNQSGVDLALDANGNVIVVGNSRNLVDFGGGPLMGPGSDDVFVASYTVDGVYRLSGLFGGPSTDHCGGVAMDGSGNVVITGTFNGTADLGSGPLTSAGGTDIFLLAFRP